MCYVRRMSEPTRTIPLRELRNDVSEVLRQVGDEGARIRVTVRGRPVADVVPVRAPSRTFVPWTVIERIRVDAPLDGSFRGDVRELLPDTAEDLEDPWTA
jgi:prevent-host-death family protein